MAEYCVTSFRKYAIGASKLDYCMFLSSKDSAAQALG